MRFLPLAALVLTALFIALPSRAEESVHEGIQQQVKPLLKALSLIGTPYKYGGKDPDKGVDCSGFVKHVYKESADISLPRTAKQMSAAGEEVEETKLQPGDLVFFNTRKKPFSHVGIYAGNGEFVHASSTRSKEVTVSRMNSRYWSNRFNGARRVLPSR